MKLKIGLVVLVGSISVVLACTDNGFKTCRSDGQIGLTVPALCWFDWDEGVWVWGEAYIWTPGGQNSDCINGDVGDGCSGTEGVCPYVKYAIVCGIPGPNPVSDVDTSWYYYRIGECPNGQNGIDVVHQRERF